MPKTLLAFDVNETLLDLTSLDPIFEGAFGDASLRPTWFALMLQLSFGGIVTDRYLEFPSAQRAALRMLAQRQGTDVPDSTVDEIVGAISELRPHPEVREALERLRASGFRMGALTNSPLDVAEAQLKSAALLDLFDEVISADEVKRLKPAPEPYQHAARRLGTQTGSLRLIAAHWWDIDGALAAGCLGAFVARPGAVLNPATPKPDVSGPDLSVIARLITEADS